MDYFNIYETLDSTNKEAHRLLGKGPVINGLTIYARHQTDGRGQLGRPWISNPGKHLAMTIIYLPEQISPSALPTQSMKISLGIVNALKKIEPSIDPHIKWPNDVYVQGKKLCGILIENALSGSRVQHMIIGIGMNINEDQFPPEIPNAISLFNLTGFENSPKQVALIIREEILAQLENKYDTWKVDYDKYIFGNGKQYHFISGNKTFEAIVKGISNEGQLMLQTNDGEIRAFSSHEVKWVL
jgi:BirA family biotin operon repressor/biotin-[acetyl-CoA-carboxylase] ligase